MGFDENDGKLFDEMGKYKLTSASSFGLPDNFKELPKEEQKLHLSLLGELTSPVDPLQPWKRVNIQQKEEWEQKKLESMQQPTDTQKIMQQFVEQQEEKILEDLINNPNHYHLGGLDVYELLQMKFTPEYYRGFCLGNILKYVLRHELKGGTKDLEKAEFNLKRLIESREGIKYIPEHKKEK